MNRKYLIPLLMVLIAISSCVYILFFSYNIKSLSSSAPEDKRQCQYHILIASEDSNSEFMKDFHEGAEYICPVFDAVVELLKPDSESDPVENSLEHWFEYAGLVDADGLIVVSNDGSFEVKRVFGSRSEGIPVVLAGECAPESRQISHIYSNIGEYARLAAVEIHRGGWNKPVALIRKSSKSEIPEKIINLLSEAGINVQVIYLNSSDVIDDEVHKVLRSFVKEESADVILCFNAEEVNLVAQMLVDQNLTDQLSLIGFDGDRKTKDYVKKGVVFSNIYSDAWQMGAASAEELFKWRNSGTFNNVRKVEPKVLQGSAK